MGIGFKELIVILVIVLVLFGAKRLKNVGSDLGSAIKNFRKSVRDGDAEASAENSADDKVEKQGSGRIIEGESAQHKDKV